MEGREGLRGDGVGLLIFASPSSGRPKIGEAAVLCALASRSWRGEGVREALARRGEDESGEGTCGE